MINNRRKKFTQWLFALSGLYGIITLVPSLGNLGTIVPDAGPETRLFYLTFVGLALAFQILFFIIAYDPIRFRPAMVPAMLDKIAFALPVMMLRSESETVNYFTPFAAIDLLLFLAFAAAFVLTRRVTD